MVLGGVHRTEWGAGRVGGRRVGVGGLGYRPVVVTLDICIL